MKVSTALFLTDILPHKRALYNKVVKNRILKDNEHDESYLALKNAGVQGVELFLPSYVGITMQDILAAKKILDTYDLPIFSLHQQLRFFSVTKIKEIEELFAMASKIGAQVVVLHMSSAGKQHFDQAYLEAIRALQNKYDIKAGFENREKHAGSIRSAYGWEEQKFGTLMEKEDLYITLDTTHLAQAGGDIISFFRKHKQRIVNIHISDYKHHYLNNSLRPLRYKHLPLGKGELPLEKFLQVLHHEHYKGLVTMEIHTDLAGICEGARMIHSCAGE